MEVLERLARNGIVPVVVLDDAKDAVPTAKAMLAGGIDVMEITFRTAAAAESIAAVARECPDMLVGAGTVINLEQCKQAVELGAKFIVSPGYDEETVAWCVENGIAVTPACVTPTEIMMAKKHGLNVLKFFPANVYGGLNAIKALAAAFPGLKFLPTGGVNPQNLAEFAVSPYVYAVGGSWVCPKKEVAAGNFDKITALCQEARKILLGFELAHLGINCDDADASDAVCGDFNAAFDFDVKQGNSSNFASGAIEVMKSKFLGEKGHIAVRTNKMVSAIAELEKRGFELDMSTARIVDGNIKTVYLKNEIGGFAVHLLQK